MDEALKKLFYTGLGAANTAAKKLQDIVEDIVEDGKISQTEGKKIVNDWKKNFEEKKSEAETKLNEVFKTTYGKVTGQEKINALEAKVNKLESKAKKGKYSKKKDSKNRRRYH